MGCTVCFLDLGACKLGLWVELETFKFWGLCSLELRATWAGYFRLVLFALVSLLVGMAFC